VSIQIIIMSFFLQAVALALGEKELAASLISIIWEALMLVEACTAIANHLDRRSTGGTESIGEG
jgi:hypothetical protein